MTDLKKLLDEAAGPEESLTDEQLAGAIGRGRRTRRRRGATVAAATAVVAVGVGGWALTLPPSGETPVAAGSGPGAGPSTCAQVVTDYRIERTTRTPGPGEMVSDPPGKYTSDGIELRLGGFPQQTDPATFGESVPGLDIFFMRPSSSGPVVFKPGATIDVPPPAGKGWPDEVWRNFTKTCYDAAG
ncbi:hypothetical protein [Kribbella sp. DT2]|uniref:hypothetical protein n=1 Tax=Kribbella sp. DT2 TaxID=3393427 RepID=UPI003CF9CC78